MTIRYLKTFIAISERGSFAAAARYLNLTQSAISMQMKTLEEDLACKLFDRSKRPPQFTEAGRVLIPKARAAIHAFEQLTVDEGSTDPNLIAGKVRIGAVPSVMTGMMPKALVALKAKHPRLHVELTMGLSADLVEQVATGKVNAAVLSDLHAQQDGLNWVPFAREPLILIVPVDAPDKSPEQYLKSYPFIRYTRQAWVGQLIDRLLKQCHFSVDEVMTLDTLEAITSMVYHGLGVSIIPSRIVETPLPLPVRQIALPKPVVSRVLGLLEHRDNELSGATNALLSELKHLVETARQDSRNGSYSPSEATNESCTKQ